MGFNPVQEENSQKTQETNKLSKFDNSAPKDWEGIPQFVHLDKNLFL